MNSEERCAWIEFGAWFQSQRQGKRISQQQLAGRIKMDRAYISEVENGKHAVRRPTVIRMAQGAGIDHREALRKAGYIPH